MRSAEFFDYASTFINDVNYITLSITEQAVEAELNQRQSDAHRDMTIQIVVVLALSCLGVAIMTSMVKGILSPIHQMEIGPTTGQET